MSLKKLAVLVAVLVLLAPQGSLAGISKGILVVTCDDGHKSLWLSLAPILGQNNFPATCYPVTNWIADDSEFMTVAQLQELKRRGWEFGNHTRNHIHPLQVSDQILLAELDEAKQDLLEWELGPVSAFAPPFGEFNSQIADLVKQRGYLSLRQAWTEDLNVNYPDNFMPFALNVVSLKSTSSLTATLAWVDKLATEKVAGILVVHKVGVTGDPYSISTAFANQIFSRAAVHVAQGKLETMTVSRMVQKMRPTQSIVPVLNLLLPE